MFHARNGLLRMGDAETDYVRFGHGERNLIMIPGLGDGLKTVKGMAIPFAILYHMLAKDFTVYSFSRRRDLSPGTGTRDMAADLAHAMEAIGIAKASVVGVSQGGMIAQWLAIDYPEMVEKLVLTVTLCRPNPTVRKVVGRWMEMARTGDFKGILIDTAEKSYSPRRVRSAVMATRLWGEIGKPKSLERFLIQAESCLAHDTFCRLEGIGCPTLVVAGADDRIVTADASREIAAKVPGGVLKVYEGLGHGLYEEEKGFWKQVASFCR